MSIWHPPPPPWFEAFTSSVSALPPPDLHDVPSPAVVAKMTFSGTGRTQRASLSHEDVDERTSPSDSIAALHTNKDVLISQFASILALVSQGDPTDSKKREELASLHSKAQGAVSNIHGLISGYRTHQVLHLHQILMASNHLASFIPRRLSALQAYELLIQELELSIDDRQCAIDALARAQEESRRLVILYSLTVTGTPLLYSKSFLFDRRALAEAGGADGEEGTEGDEGGNIGSEGHSAGREPAQKSQKR